MARKRKTLPSNPVEYPSGTFVHTEKGYFYVAGPTTRHHFITQRVVDSWRPHRVVETTEAACSNYKVLGKMKFRNGSLLYSQASGKMYLVSENKLRHITSPDILEYLQVQRTDAVWVSDKEINLHEEGEPLN